MAILAMSRRAILALPWLGKPTGETPVLPTFAEASAGISGDTILIKLQPRGAEAALDGPAGDTDPNVAYTWGYGLDGSAAKYARLEKVTLPGGREIYYNYEDANAFAPWHGHLGHESQGHPGPALRRESTGGTPVVLMGETPMPLPRAGGRSTWHTSTWEPRLWWKPIIPPCLPRWGRPACPKGPQAGG